MEDLGLIRLKRSARPGRFILPCLLVALIAYFAFHALNGDRGVRAWLDVRHQLAVADKSLADLEAIGDRLERKVALMRPESLDPDLLDEQVRTRLGYTGANEIVILRRQD